MAGQILRPLRRGDGGGGGVGVVMNNWFDETRYGSLHHLQNLLHNTKLITPPMLMLPWIRPRDAGGGGDGDDDEQVFYSFADDRYYDLPVPRKLFCIGSSRGWLILVDRCASLTLLNPMSRTRIPLSRATGIRELNVTYSDLSEGRTAWEMLSWHRAVLSSDPHYSHSFSLAVILGGGGGRAAMYRSTTGAWHYLPNLLLGTPWTDAVFHRGELYTACRLGVYNHEHRSIWPIAETSSEGSRYLVETPDGDLFLVIRDYGHGVLRPEENQRRRRTTGFRVYRRQEGAPYDEWLPTRSLNGFVLFVGTGTSFALLAAHTGRRTGGLIFFLNAENDRGPAPSLSSDCGVFCLREGRMRPPSGSGRPRPSPQHSVWRRPPAVWVAPTAVSGFRALGNLDGFVVRG